MGQYGLCLIARGHACGLFSGAGVESINHRRKALGCPVLRLITGHSIRYPQDLDVTCNVHGARTWIVGAVAAWYMAVRLVLDEP